MNSTKSLAVIPTSPTSHATRAAGLIAEAKREADAHLQESASLVRDAIKMIAAIETGVDLYNPGLREEARQLVERMRVGLDRLITLGGR